MVSFIKYETLIGTISYDFISQSYFARKVKVVDKILMYIVTKNNNLERISVATQIDFYFQQLSHCLKEQFCEMK